MTRTQHFLFHLGDLLAAMVGVVHGLIDTPPDPECKEPIAEGFKRWGDANGAVAKPDGKRRT